MASLLVDEAKRLFKEGDALPFDALRGRFRCAILYRLGYRREPCRFRLKFIW